MMTPIDVLQFFLAVTIFAAMFVRRQAGRRFQSSNRICSGDTITTKIGQLGLAVCAAAAFALGMEALGWFRAAYNEMVLVMLAGQAMIGVRIICSAHLMRIEVRRGIVRDG